jgi:hypothetical protein
MKSTIFGVLLVAICPAVAVAEQFTLACVFEGSERRGPEREKD